MAKAPTATKSIRHWGPSGTSAAHTTVVVRVGTPARS